jgi:hypothetical protein
METVVVTIGLIHGVWRSEIFHQVVGVGGPSKVKNIRLSNGMYFAKYFRVLL